MNTVYYLVGAVIVFVLLVVFCCGLMSKASEPDVDDGTMNVLEEGKK